MSTLFQTETTLKLGTTFALSDLQAIESWGANKFVRAEPSNDASAAQSSANGVDLLDYRKIPRDEPCFVTARPSYVHECAHLIYPIRGKEPKYQEAEEKVLSYLNWQGIVNFPFALNHPSNLINLDIWLHKAMDTYAMFALTCSNATLDTLIGILEAENKIADTAAAEGRNYIRDLQIRRVSEAARYEMVVLHPRHFLPKDTHLLCYHSGSPMLYGVNPTGLLQEDSTKSAFPELSPPSRPNAGDRLNPYLVVLAAEIKFRRFRKSPDRHTLPSEYETLIDKTIKVADLLYYTPYGEAWAKQFLPRANAMSIDETDTGSEKSSGREFEYSTANADEAGGSTTHNFDPRALLFGHDNVPVPDDLELLREMAQGELAADVRLDQVEAWRNGVLPNR